MNGNLYQIQPLVKQSFFQRLLKQEPEENALIELNNLLAQKQIHEITLDEFKFIEDKYKVSLLKAFRLNLEEFYAVYLNYCLADKLINEDELRDLEHIKKIFDLDDKTINNIHVKLGELIYKQTFEEAVADGRLSKNEETFLTELENTLRLPKDLAEKISAETRSTFMDNYIQQVVSDQRLSPSEEKELETISKSLNVNLQINEQSKTQLEKLKLYWALENLDLPIINVDINIQKSEVCHISIPNVNWFELRSTTQRVSYSGYSTRIKVTKGFYLRSGSFKPQSYSTESMRLIDSGTIYLTNKRIIFTGSKKNSIIRIDKILNFNPYSDGVEISKETGKNPALQLGQNADVFCMILERLLSDQ